MRSLSKSQYSKGRKCLKKIWLFNFRKDLIKEPSTFQESLITHGNEVGELARHLYPEGVLIEEDHHDIDKAIIRTQMEIKNGTEVLFEAAFLAENVVVRVDILVRNADDSFDLIEVKSSTKLKKEHITDCAIQAYVLQQSNIRLRNICLAYLNNNYVREGDINLADLFHIESIDSSVIESELTQIPEYLSKINQTLASHEEPYKEIGSICNNPDCMFKHYCWKDVSDKSIHYLYRINDDQRSQFISQEIELIRDVPESYVKGGQKIQVLCEKNNTLNIDKQKIEEHLTKLKYPPLFFRF